jgi:hypothetical protein
MNILLVAPDLESKYKKSAKGFNIPYPIMFSTSGLQLLAALTKVSLTLRLSLWKTTIWNMPCFLS